MSTTSKCSGCGRVWTGTKECHCAKCHLHFSSMDAFDRHRIAIPDSDEERICVDPIELKRKDKSPVLVQIERAGGLVWSKWHADPNPHGRASEART